MQSFTAQHRRLLAALTQPLAQALARAQLAQELEAARLHGETEQLRSALLASVSHDLRTPLTSMRELLEGTRDEAERLDRYIPNLLDMTRLGHAGARLGVASRYRRQRAEPPAGGADAVAGPRKLPAICRCCTFTRR